MVSSVVHYTRHRFILQKLRAIESSNHRYGSLGHGVCDLPGFEALKVGKRLPGKTDVCPDEKNSEISASNPSRGTFTVDLHQAGFSPHDPIAWIHCFHLYSPSSLQHLSKHKSSLVYMHRDQARRNLVDLIDQVIMHACRQAGP